MSPIAMKGYIQLYTGDGKGKTTAALGLALRAAGAGLAVFIGQFIKGKGYSEDRALATLRRAIRVERFGRGCFVRGKPKASDVTAARRGIARCEKAILSGKYDVVILDEAAVAARLGLFPVEELLWLADLKPPAVELVITGRGAHPKLLKRADLVTEMREKKHYFRRGVKARKGIEL
ncbi:MAG: cob(I)yrinic acid a,c-diamide adenosyltransferase [Candidatus Aureabacteria bacterium]|nr:cob(I)yrinic acid a,c-diamide adenosyltransferase [Candidatus Auribacterota bacterium]